MCYYMPRLHVLKYIWLLFSIVFLLPQMLYKRQLELNAVLHYMYILCVYIYFWSHKASKVLKFLLRCDSTSHLVDKIEK